MWKILSIILSVFFCLFDCFSLNSSDITIENSVVKNVKDGIECVVNLSVPNPWKISQHPEFASGDDVFIKTLKTNKINEQNYSCHLLFKNGAKQTKMKVNFAACADVCMFANKDFELNLSKEFDKANDLSPNFWYIILLAFIGGFILNFMPCVLPVLTIKLRSFAKRDSADKKHLLYTFCGIFCCFLAFATSVAVLKNLGHAVGWGMHFQNANFLNVATLLVFVFMMYAYERVNLNISTKTDLSSKGEFAKEFSSGIIATILAIPCTAPFLGTAATFALQGSNFDLFVIFSIIALGFGSPYLLGYFIKIPTFIKPGKWMMRFKNILNLGIVLTFIWLFWLLSNHLSSQQLILTALLYTVLFVTLGKYKLATVVACVLMMFVPNIQNDQDVAESLFNVNASGWQKFSEEALTEHVKNKKVVFINITADWCMTCQYNKAVVLRNESFLKFTKENNVLLMEGDITYPNEEIRKFLAKHGRSGIPFNVVYGPSAPEGISLSVMPSLMEIKAAVENAK